MLAIARLPEVTLVTIGDLIRVPASRGTLAAERAAGADVRVVYSPRDAVRIAADEPHRQVVFAGIGFETTAPTTAAALLEARAVGLANFSLLSLHKTMGKMVLVTAAEAADAVVAAVRATKYGGAARRIGFVTAAHPGRVALRTPFGTRRVLDMPVGELLPRIC